DTTASGSAGLELGSAPPSRVLVRAGCGGKETTLGRSRGPAIAATATVPAASCARPRGERSSKPSAPQSKGRMKRRKHSSPPSPARLRCRLYDTDQGSYERDPGAAAAGSAAGGVEEVVVEAPLDPQRARVPFVLNRNRRVAPTAKRQPRVGEVHALGRRRRRADGAGGGGGGGGGRGSEEGLEGCQEAVRG
ncbi:hypothetical protein TSOC_013719, partial [Tetrabaena socialis]